MRAPGKAIRVEALGRPRTTAPDANDHAPLDWTCNSYRTLLAELAQLGRLDAPGGDATIATKQQVVGPSARGDQCVRTPQFHVRVGVRRAGV